jgi:hypothetical protein
MARARGDDGVRARKRGIKGSREQETVKSDGAMEQAGEEVSKGPKKRGSVGAREQGSERGTRREQAREQALRGSDRGSEGDSEPGRNLKGRGSEPARQRGGERKWGVRCARKSHCYIKRD